MSRIVCSKSKVLVFLLRCDADVASRRQAPVVGGQLVVPDQLHEPFDVPQGGIREPLLKPVCLLPEVARRLEMLDRVAACFADRLERAARPFRRPSATRDSSLWR